MTGTGPGPCKHLNSEVLDANRIGCATCRDCHVQVCLTDVFNNWIAELKTLRAK